MASGLFKICCSSNKPLKLGAGDHKYCPGISSRIYSPLGTFFGEDKLPSPLELKGTATTAGYLTSQLQPYLVQLGVSSPDKGRPKKFQGLQLYFSSPLTPLGSKKIRLKIRLGTAGTEGYGWGTARKMYVNEVILREQNLTLNCCQPLDTY